jgi:hypothetical protein
VTTDIVNIVFYSSVLVTHREVSTSKTEILGQATAKRKRNFEKKHGVMLFACMSRALGCRVCAELAVDKQGLWGC